MLAFTARKPLTADEPFVPNSFLQITTGTFQKRPFMSGDDRMSILLESLDFNSFKWQWRIIAFVLLDNHYHLLAQTPPGDASRLAHIIQSAHSYAAYHWRRDDPSIRTRIWWNFWDSPIHDMGALRHQINYIHANPKMHGKIEDPTTYAFSSYRDYLKQDAATIHKWEEEYPAGPLIPLDNF